MLRRALLAVLAASVVYPLRSQSAKPHITWGQGDDPGEGLIVEDSRYRVEFHQLVVYVSDASEHTRTRFGFTQQAWGNINHYDPALKGLEIYNREDGAYHPAPGRGGGATVTSAQLPQEMKEDIEPNRQAFARAVLAARAEHPRWDRGTPYKDLIKDLLDAGKEQHR